MERNGKIGLLKSNSDKYIKMRTVIASGYFGYVTITSDVHKLSL